MLFTLSLMVLLPYEKCFSQTKYEMNDLKILYGQKAHSEFLKHAHDIRPIFRNKEWQDMVEQMAMTNIEELIEKSAYNDKDIERVFSISNWPSLANNEFFIEKRNKYMLKAISTCHSGKKSCKELPEKLFLLTNPPEFSYDLLKNINLSEYPKETLMKYLSPLISHKVSEFYCDKEPVNELLITYLITDKSDKNHLNIHTKCFDKLSLYLKKRIQKNTKDSEYAYKLLKRYKKLDQETNEWFLINNFLSQKENFAIDESIEALKSYAKSSEKRHSTISKLRLFSVLPDNIFGLKPKISKARMRILQRTFPEYFEDRKSVV